MLDGSSPRKSKLETSKRALFQSPPSELAGPSKLISMNNPEKQKIKRVLFSPSKKMDDDSEGMKQPPPREESRKRKCEEELQGPRLKWAKSLSFDCTHELANTSRIVWDRHSSSSILSKNDTSFTQGRNELSDTHRKVYMIYLVFSVFYISMSITFSGLFLEITLGDCGGPTKQRHRHESSEVQTVRCKLGTHNQKIYAGSRK